MDETSSFLLFSTARSSLACLKRLFLHRGKKVFITLAHHLLDVRIFQENYIEKIFGTDTIASKKCKKIEIISTAQYFGQQLSAF